EMIEYFAGVLEQKVRLREPVILYHHPNNRHESVLREIMANVRHASLPAMRLIDFALWWKKRESSMREAELRDSMLLTRGTSSGGGTWWHITREVGMECFAPPAASTDLNSVSWTVRPAVPALPADVARVRKYNPWIAVNNIEDTITRMFRS